MTEYPSNILEILGKMEIRFGLRAQGKLDLVQQRVDEDINWELIAKEIGWEVEALKEWYKIEADPEKFYCSIYGEPFSKIDLYDEGWDDGITDIPSNEEHKNSNSYCIGYEEGSWNN